MDRKNLTARGYENRWVENGLPNGIRQSRAVYFRLLMDYR
jgi:hypothetical protein